MISAGELTETVAFYRRNDTTDDYGNPTSGYEATPYFSARCKFEPLRSRERLEAGRLSGTVAGTIWLRRSADAEAITAADKAVINGVEYQLRSPPVTTGYRDRFVEMDVERGVVV